MKNLIMILVMMSIVSCGSLNKNVEPFEYEDFKPAKDKPYIQHAANVVASGFTKLFSCNNEARLSNYLYSYGYKLLVKEKGLFGSPLCKLVAPKIVDYANEALMKTKIMKIGECTGDTIKVIGKAGISKLCDAVPF